MLGFPSSHDSDLFVDPIQPSLVFKLRRPYEHPKTGGYPRGREQQGYQYHLMLAAYVLLFQVSAFFLSQESHDHSLLNPGYGAHLRPRLTLEAKIRMAQPLDALL